MNRFVVDVTQVLYFTMKHDQRKEKEIQTCSGARHTSGFTATAVFKSIRLILQSIT